MKIKIATFNVNSIKSRLSNVLSWAKSSQVDIILLQEIKCEEANFPFDEFAELGYNVAISGQKTYNGVAILSKFKIEDVIKGLPNFENDLGVKPSKSSAKPQNEFDLFFADENSQDKKSQQARYIEAIIVINKTAIRVASIYVPNGGGEILPNQKLEESEKFIYKMNFFDALKSRLEDVLQYDEIAIFGGDFNVANHEIDVYDAKNLEGTVCFHSSEKQKFRSILGLGLIDCYRAFNQQNQAFTWWDYRGNSWQYNKGMRIDYILASPLAADKLSNCVIEDKGVRDQEKASDHCPVVLQIDV